MGASSSAVDARDLTEIERWILSALLDGAESVDGPQTDHLIALGLVWRAGSRVSLTPSGRACIAVYIDDCDREAVAHAQAVRAFVDSIGSPHQ